MNIGFNFNNGEIITSQPKKDNTAEIEALQSIIEHMNLDINKFHIVKNSDEYTTLKYYMYDLIRLKKTTKTQWLSILMVKPYKDKYIDDVRFVDQKNKNQLNWKSYFDDMYNYEDVLTDAIAFIDSQIKK